VFVFGRLFVCVNWNFVCVCACCIFWIYVNVCVCVVCGECLVCVV